MFDMIQVSTLLAAFLCAFCLSFYIIPLFIKIAFARQILDVPTSLKNHKAPTPYLGGLAVYTTFIIVLALFFPVYWNLSLFLIGATLLLILGLIDDLMPLSALYKFLGQFIAALCFLKGGFSFKQLFIEYFALWGSTYILGFVSLMWILTLVNAINLVDIMDGLAATVALGGLSGLFIFAAFYQLYSVALLIIICIGALAGFLLFNKSPAKIYLGDAGSLFIGGMLATIPFMIPWGTYTLVGFLSPVIILGIPLLEVAMLILIRTALKIPFYQGSPHHFAHYLLKKGWSKDAILCFVALVNICLIVISLLFNFSYISLFQAICLLILMLIIWCATLYSKNTLLFAKKH